VVQLLWSVGILSLGAVYTVAAVTGISTGPGDPHALTIVTGTAVVAAAALVGILRSTRRSLLRKVVVGAGTSVLLLGTALAALHMSRGLAERVEPPVSSALAEQDRPNIILISVDTLRADCPGFDGGRARTPNMDALARESVLFERAYSVSPWTRPAFASLFTSRYPSDVGVGRVLGREGVGTDAVPYVWDADLDTGVEILQRAGYLTAAVVTNPNLTTMANADQGFDAFFHVTRSMQKPPARMVSYKLLGALLGGPLQRRLTDAVSSYTLQRAERVDVAAEAMLRSLLPRPALLWVHYMDPHDPYDAPTAGPEFQIAPNRTHTLASLQFLTAASRQRMQEAYIREIEYFDNWLGSLIDRLKARDLWDESIVVFLSDHGEEFWDHGSWGHGQSLYNEQLRVPLMIHLPDSNRGRRVEAPVSLLDVFPTLLALCGAEPHPEMEGRDRSALLSGGGSDGFEIFLETCMMGSIRKGIMNDRFKLIHDSSGDSYRLYDMVADPAERHNIMGRVQTPEISRLRGRLDSFTERSLASMADYSGREAGETPPELRDQLRDMGYLQ
jgi:arylsulfatase